ncbi:MAG: ankyrin repeat domain-containing protein, partial [Planctomycetales bacterium]|nr:ankyrin repeat domain-containing protein [Planctomycetales bacterium]
MQAWSKKLKSPVLRAGEQNTACVVYYWLYENGDCAEVFESDGQWFRGGVEIDPEIQDESKRMQGTSFSSLRREPEDVDWSAYESEWQFVDEFFRSEDAYLTFLWAGFSDDGKLKLNSYHDDETAAENIERVDVAFYQPTAMQKRAAETPPPTPEEDALLEAIKAGDEDGVDAAIAAGADIHKRFTTGQGTYLETAVKHAVWCKSEAIVEKLLRAGADPNVSGPEPILASLTLHAGTTIIDIRIINLLLNAGAEIDARQTDKALNPFAPGGRTALAVASSLGTLNGVRLLLKSGASTAIRDDAGKTALELATAHLRVVKKWSLKPSPPDDIKQRIADAQEVVDLLEAIEAGRIDVASLPEPDEIIADEERR